MTPAEQEAFDAMRGALEKMIKSRDDHAFQEEKHVESEFGAYWSPSASMIDSEAVAIGRKALVIAKAVQPDFSYQATIAGLEASIGHLSALVNEQLLLLEEVNDNLGVDGLGAELDDDQSPTIAKVRAHLAAMTPPVQPQAQADSGRIIECAKRLVEHADFQLGGILSADSKAKDIPSKAVSQVKSRHLAALRDALSAPPATA
ncbi:MAG: hypothetical protein QE279_01890 [Rhodoferax sp.]|nr:hypothetical protein [Rhodoferax sp.]